MYKRNEVIDIMKGIGIIAVIIGHMGSVSIIPFHIFIFSFHMPLFFIIAGYFFKPNNNFINKFKRDFSRLVIPYLFTASILVVFNILQSFIGEEKKPDVITIGIISALFGSGAYHFSPIWGNMPAIGAIWFLLALFWCRVVYNYIACKTQHKYLIAGIIAICATLIDKYLINLPFTILPGLSGMMFYLIGNWLKTHKVSYIIIIISLVCWIISILYSQIGMVVCNYGLYPIDIMGACGGTAFIYWISKYCAKTKLKSLFVWLGVNSLVLLCFHLIELKCRLCFHLHVPDIFFYKFLVKMLFCMGMTWLCYRFEITRKIFTLKKEIHV